MCYVYNQWYDISCATLYIRRNHEVWLMKITLFLNMTPFLQVITNSMEELDVSISV